MAIKHVGRMKSTQRKVIVAYRTIPGDPYSAVVVPTEILSNDEHDTIIQCVESPTGQNAYEFCEAMARTQLPDGRNLLAGLHTTGRMIKVSTSEVEMTPDTKTVINLDELNQIIAEQKGVSLEDLALKGAENTPTTVEDVATVEEVPSTIVGDALEAGTDEVISDEQLAAKYRSDADRLFKEAKRLREEAEKLVPTKKKTTSKESV